MFNSKEYCLSPTMDHLETASNISDNHSEGLSSNLSSLSGLTGYEDELYDLKHLIKLPSSSPRLITKLSDNHHGQYEVFEARIQTLSTELQNALKSNEKYKNDMCNLERKTELAFHEKFEKLMRHNAQLEAKLAVASDRIHNFLYKSISDCGGRNENGETAQLEQKVTRLEKQDFELHSKIDLLKSEVKHWRKEAETNEVVNSRLKLEIEEMKIEVSTKSNSIDALKSKIVDLHLEMQNLNQDSVKVNNLLAITTNELNSFKKSETWYKEQLHQCRAQKSEASEEISRLHSLLIAKERDLDVKNSDFLRLKNNFDDLQFTTRQEKQNLLKTMHQLQLNTCSVKAPPKIINLEDQNLSENYQSTIESLTRELLSIKEAIDEQQLSFEGINKQNSELIARNTTLQKTLNDKEIFICNLENDKKDLNVRLEITLERLRDNERLLMKTVDEKSEIEVALSGANREKREIEGAVRTIRENFAKFAGNYNKIKEELNEKTKRIFELQNKQLSFGSCSAQLKETSRKIVEVEEVNRKLNQHIVALQNEQVNFNSCSVQLIETNRKIAQLQEVNKKLQTEIETLNNNLQETKKDLKTTNEIKERLESEVMSYGNLREELQMLKDHMATVTEELHLREKLVDNLKGEINDLTKERHESEALSQQKIATNAHELQVLKSNMAMVTEELHLRDKLVADLRKEANDLRKNIESHQETNGNLVQRLNIAEKSLNDSQSKFGEVLLLQKENSELRDKVAKFVTNNFNGFNNRINKTDVVDRSTKEETCTCAKQNELELWFSSILERIVSNLLEIQARHNPKQNIELISNSAQISPQQSNKTIEEPLQKISQLLVSISSRTFADFEQLQQMSLNNKKLRLDTSRIKNKILEPLNYLEDRCHLLDKRQEKDFEALETIKNVKNEWSCKQISNLQSKKEEEKLQEELKQLKILYKAKELENNEKRKRYEVNNRTLLKKVKEHMRGRNSAEKRCSYLQELYNNVFDELNSYKLQENSKDGEIQNLQNVCENYKNINVKMKQELLRMEKELSMAEATKALVCDKCVKYEALNKIVADLEAKLRIYESQLKEKEIFISNIQIEVQQIVLNNATLQKENKSLLEKMEKFNDELSERKEDIIKLEAIIEKERNTMEEVHKKLLDEQKQHSVCVMQLENVQQISQHTQEKNKLLSEEIELLNCKLNQSNDEFNNLQGQKNLLEDSWSQKENHMHIFTTNLQSEIQVLQNDLISARTDKQFLQRLCSDLKLALQTSMNQSKVLKKHVQTLSSESKECSSLPDSIVNLPSPSKYDDAYINQLLKQSSAPPMEKPLGDLQNCLNSLKKEMSCLRKQVSERAGYRV